MLDSYVAYVLAMVGIIGAVFLSIILLIIL